MSGPGDRRVGQAGSVFDDAIQNRGELLQFVDVRGNELVQPPFAVGREPDPDNPPVIVVLPPFQKPGRLGPVDELNRALWPEQQVTGNIANCRAILARSA